jgi:uncharacterized protein YabE (DUF348 family)/3D (Asp-Asp-Asp) domain-containing protein
LLALVLAGSLLGGLVVGWQMTGAPLVVEIDGHRHELRTHAATVGKALRQARFDLYPEDIVSPGLEVPLEADTVIQVRRARPLALRADGHTRQLRTQATTVGAFLAEAGVGIGPGDEIWLGERQVRLDTSLLAGSLNGRQVTSRGGGRATTAGSEEHAPLLAVRRAASLTLDDGGRVETIYTTDTTVGQVLAAHGVELTLGDAVSPGLQQRVTAGMTVSIQRSIPAQIAVDGRLIRTRTRAKTVAGLLGQEGIALMGKDRVEPELGAPVLPGGTVRVTRVREALLVEFDPIPFETVWVPDPKVEIDNIRLVQDGQVGLNKRRYRVVYENGQEVGRFLEDSWADQSPITKTMAYGTKIVVRTLETPEGPIEYWRKMRVYLTSYKPASCGKPRDHPRYGYTRLGWKLKKGIVAVDPTVIPLKTTMYVPGYGVARAGDTGGGVKGKFVDLGYGDDDYQSWHWWGEVYLMTPVPSPDKIRYILPDWPKFPDRRR